MKNDNKKRKGKGSLIIIIETLVCTVVFMAIILLTLLLLDKEYSKVHSIMTCFKGGIHPHFSGDTWFSIAASGMAAIPGVFCGILALLQTERINKMEARYHRPVLGFQNASMKIMRLHDERYQKKSKVKDYEEVFFCEWLVKKKPEKNPEHNNYSSDHSRSSCGRWIISLESGDENREHGFRRQGEWQL